jgi:hypothetical protein
LDNKVSFKIDVKPEPKAVDLAANVLGVGAAAGADPKAAPGGKNTHTF